MKELEEAIVCLRDYCYHPDKGADESIINLQKQLIQVNGVIDKFIGQIDLLELDSNKYKIVENNQEINKQLIEEKEKLSKQLIIQQTVNKQLTEQLIDQQTINTKLNIEIQGLRDKMEEQNRRLKYYQGKEIRREKEHQVCIDKIKELQEEIESFEKGSLAVKLNEVTKERNEAVFELSEEKQKNLTVINQMNKLKEELIESEENRDQLVEFNRNYQEDIRRLEEENNKQGDLVKYYRKENDNFYLNRERREEQIKGLDKMIGDRQEKIDKLQKKINIICKVIDM